MTDETLDRAIRAFYEDAELSDSALDRLEPKRRLSPIYAALIVLAAAATLFVALQSRPAPTAAAPPPPTPAAEETLTWSVQILKVAEAPLDETDELILLADDFGVPEGAQMLSKPEIVTQFEQSGHLIMGGDAPDRLDLKLVAHHAGDDRITVYAKIVLWGEDKGSVHEVDELERPAKLGLTRQVDGEWYLVVVDV